MHRWRRHARPIRGLSSRDFFCRCFDHPVAVRVDAIASPPRYTFLRLVGEIREMVKAREPEPPPVPSSHAVRAANPERERRLTSCIFEVPS